MSTPTGAGPQQKLTVAMIVRDAADLLAETLEGVKLLHITGRNGLTLSDSE